MAALRRGQACTFAWARALASGLGARELLQAVISRVAPVPVAGDHQPRHPDGNLSVNAPKIGRPLVQTVNIDETVLV